MKKLYLFLALSIFLLAASCRKDCPPDQKIGEKPLTSKSLSFFPYKGRQKLVFKDQEGVELVLTTTVGVLLEESKISIYKQCTEVKFDGNSSYKYFAGQSKNVVFFSQNPNFALSCGLFTSALRPEEELLYDKLVVEVSGVAPVGRGEIVTDIRFTETYEEEELGINSPMEYIDTLALNNTFFVGVYASELENGQIFYNKEKGIVGFKTTGAIYSLDRIE